VSLIPEVAIAKGTTLGMNFGSKDSGIESWQQYVLFSIYLI
jgi:hypothetical protein